MRVRLAPSGQVWVDLYRTQHWVRLRQPTIREWADWLDEGTTILASTIDALAAGDLGELDGLALNGRIARYAWEVLATTATASLDPPAGHQYLAEGLPLAIADRDFIPRLLDHWWDKPLAPWPRYIDPNSPAPPRKRRGKDDPKPITTTLPGGRGVLAVAYKVLGQVGMGAGFTPRQVDEMEIWQIAAWLGQDNADDDDTDGDVTIREDGQYEAMNFTRRPGQAYYFGDGGGVFVGSTPFPSEMATT